QLAADAPCHAVAREVALHAGSLYDHPYRAAAIATVAAVSDRDHTTPDDVAAQRGAPEDVTGQQDISYYRHSALGRLMTAEASRRARRARREALLLLPVVAGVILLWNYREDLFGTDVPVRIAAALLLAAVGWRF